MATSRSEASRLFYKMKKFSVGMLPASALRPGMCVLSIAPGGGTYATSMSRIRGAPWWKFAEIDVCVLGTRGDPIHTNVGIKELLRHKGELPQRWVHQGYIKDLNTPGQVAYLVKYLLKNSWLKTVILSTAEYHLPRLLLTFIKSWLRDGDNRPLHFAGFPTANPQNPDPNTATNQTVEGEIERIEIFDDVADEHDLMLFRNWWGQNW